MAGGQDLEPYWEVYRQHFRGHVVSWMEVSCNFLMFALVLIYESQKSLIHTMFSPHIHYSVIVSETFRRKKPKRHRTSTLVICMKVIPFGTKISWVARSSHGVESPVLNYWRGIISPPTNCSMSETTWQSPTLTKKTTVSSSREKASRSTSLPWRIWKKNSQSTRSWPPCSALATDVR